MCSIYLVTSTALKGYAFFKTVYKGVTSSKAAYNYPKVAEKS